MIAEKYIAYSFPQFPVRLFFLDPYPSPSLDFPWLRCVRKRDYLDSLMQYALKVRCLGSKKERKQNKKPDAHNRVSAIRMSLVIIAKVKKEGFFHTTRKIANEGRGRWWLVPE